MTRREQLQDQYEDALFALLMDEVATSEGKKALEENERLKNDPDAAVPEEVSRRCQKTIHRHFVKQRATTAGRFTIKALSKVAMLAGICTMLFSAAFAASPVLRANTLNLVVETFRESTDFYFTRDTPSDTYTIVAGWLPDGYILESREENAGGSIYNYQKTESEYVYVQYTRGDGTLMSADTEDAKTESISINGVQAVMIEKDNDRQIIWNTPNKTAFIFLFGSNITKEDLVHIAEQLKY